MTKKMSKMQAVKRPKYSDDEKIKMASGTVITIKELKEFIKSESLAPEDLFDEDFLKAYTKEDEDEASHIPD